jgi:hypothetical protein
MRFHHRWVLPVERLGIDGARARATNFFDVIGASAAPPWPRRRMPFPRHDSFPRLAEPDDSRAITFLRRIRLHAVEVQQSHLH